MKKIEKDIGERIRKLESKNQKEDKERKEFEFKKLDDSHFDTIKDRVDEMARKAEEKVKKFSDIVEKKAKKLAEKLEGKLLRDLEE